MYRSGAFVADRVSPTEPAQVQPNGVDLTLESVWAQTERGLVGREEKRVGERRAVEPEDDGAEGSFRLAPGGYVVGYAETISIPEEHVGFVYPRSTLMRNGSMLNTAVWDAGYEGRGEGLLQVHYPITVERGARIAQLVLAEADHEATYDGSYQGERLD